MIHGSFACTQLNGFSYCCITLIVLFTTVEWFQTFLSYVMIQFDVNNLFPHCKNGFKTVLFDSNMKP